MSVEAIGDRIAAIHSKIDALLGTGAAAPGFDAALASASAAPATTAATPVSAGAAVLPTGGASGPTPFNAEIEAAAARHGIDPALLKALIKQESGFDPNARSPAGASGLTQLMPGTAASLGVTNPLDPAQAIEGGAKYLKQQLDAFGGDIAKALAAYNAGPGAVQKHGGIPPYAETQNYVRKVMGYMQEFKAQGLGSVSLASPLATGAAAAPAMPSPVAASPSQFGIV